MEASHYQSMPNLQTLNDAAEIKQVFSTFLRRMPTDKRLEMTMKVINTTRDQAIHTLKKMWAICEVVKEEEIWRPDFDSFEAFKSTLPFPQVIDQMLRQYGFLDGQRVPLNLKLYLNIFLAVK